MPCYVPHGSIAGRPGFHHEGCVCASVVQLNTLAYHILVSTLPSAQNSQAVSGKNVLQITTQVIGIMLQRHGFTLLAGSEAATCNSNAVPMVEVCDRLP